MPKFSGNIQFEFELAIRQGNVRRIATLTAKGFKPFQAAILYALKQKQYETIEVLAAGGADLDGIDGYGDTALHYAIDFRSADIVKRLICLGANPNKMSMWTLPLVCATTKANIEVIQLLLKHGADPNGANPTDLTPLWEASRYGYLDIMKLLLKAGADPHQKGPGGLRAIDIAKTDGQVEAVKLLRQAMKLTPALKQNRKTKAAKTGQRAQALMKAER